MSRIVDISIGEIEVIALRDGEAAVPADVLLNLSEDDAATIAADENNSLSQTNINAHLIRSGDRVMLVDAGARELFGPTCGFLIDALAEAGVSPGDVTDLFFTHLHPDHVAGALTPEGGAVFENAALKVVDAERSFWTDESFDAVEVNGADWAGLAQAVLSAYANQVESITSDGELMPGVTVVSIPGHTPGHVGFRVDSDSQSMIHLGDIMHVPVMQLIDPRVATVFDIDGEAALASRIRMLDMVSADQLLCTSSHMLSPKFAHIERASTGYAVVQ
ncbi:MAG: MBL fold metallo-hydrolase [Alphaproteobacteria bacterium TMED89]|nr:hypothetical protein [Rhodospirillaceae bacterium]RPH10637.1 MAG: MBL fold metallo-hydrolase [Alphaproteobacteria bacterium TMED89]